MNLLTFLRDLVRRSSGGSLRNKPGGLAWIRSEGLGNGSDVIAGRYVTTVRADQRGFWVIEPRLSFVARGFIFAANGVIAPPGVVCEVTEIHDDSLVPLPGTGVTAKEVDRLYRPSPAPASKQVA